MRSNGSVIAVVSLVVVAGAWFALRSGAEQVAVPGAPPAVAAAEDVRSPVAAATAAVPVGTRSGEVAAEAAADVGRTVVESAPVKDTMARVSGRLVDPAGGGRGGIEVRWRSGAVEGPFGFALREPTAQERERNVTRSLADGRFSFLVERGHGGSLELDVDRFVFAAGGVRFATAAGDADLGDVLVVEPSRIRGTVVDRAGAPVAGVQVRVQSGESAFGVVSEGRSDEGGKFDVGALHPGKWTLRTLSARHLPDVSTHELAAAEVKDVHIVLEAGRSIAGQVIDDLGMPVAGAKVGAMRKERQAEVAIERFTTAESTTTDAGGFFVLGGLTGDVATVRATSESHTTAEKPGVAVGTGDLVLQVARRATVSGVLRDTAGHPIAGSRVNAGPPRSGAAGGHLQVEDGEGVLAGIEESAVTEADGSFTLTRVTPGTVVVRARGNAHRPTKSAPFPVQPGQEVKGVALVADLGAVLAVEVVDEAGAPVADASVEVRSPKVAGDAGNSGFRFRSVRIGADDDDAGPALPGDGPERLGRGRTDAAGKVEIGGLPAGRAEAIASRSDLAESKPAAVVLPASGSVATRLVLRRPGAVSVGVTLPDGTPTAASFVVHGPIGVGEDERDRPASAGASGTTIVHGLAPGDYWAQLRLEAKPREFGGAMIMLADEGRPLPATRVAFHVAADRTAEVALRMPILTRVHGAVTGADGPAGDVEIELVELGERAPDGPPADLLGGAKARSAADGSYSIADVLPGRYRLQWGKGQQVVKAETVVEIAANQREVVQNLDLRYGKLRVRVVTAEGDPIENAEVELVPAARAADGAPRRQERRMMMISINNGDGGNTETTSMTVGAARAATDVDGIAEIADVPPATYSVRIRQDRFAPKNLDGQVVAEHATTDCGTVQLDAAGRIRGQVVGADGKPAGLAMVTCAKVGAEGPPEQQPSMNGSFSFAGLAAGRYRLHAQALGPQAQQSGPDVEVDVAAGKTAGGIELHLPD